VRCTYCQGVAMERSASGNALLNFGARLFFLQCSTKIDQALRTNINNQTTSRTRHVLSQLAQWVPAQCSLSNMKIPAFETDIIDREYLCRSRQVFPAKSVELTDPLRAA
jgi:hypothetical protein